MILVASKTKVFRTVMTLVLLLDATEPPKKIAHDYLMTLGMSVMIRLAK